jgi:hypothetical protein
VKQEEVRAPQPQQRGPSARLDPSVKLPSTANPLLNSEENRMVSNVSEEEKKDIFLAGLLFGGIIVLFGVAGYKVLQWAWSKKEDVAETLKLASETSTP